MDELPRNAREIVRLARDQHDCQDDQARVRVRERLGHSVGPEHGGLGAPRLAGSAGKGALLGGGAKLVLAAGLVALVVTGAALRGRDARGASAAPVVRQIASAPSAPATPVSDREQRAAASENEDRAAMAPRRASRGRGEPRASSAPALESPSTARERRAADPLDAELALLRRVSRAVAAEDVLLASRLLAQHRKRFARPALEEERDGFEAVVQCLTKRRGASERARAFLDEHPRSVLAQRVAQACSRADESR